MFCSLYGCVGVTLRTRGLYLSGTGPYLRACQSCLERVNMRNPSARGNVLGGAEIVSNILIYRGFPLLPYKYDKDQDSTP